MAELSQKEIELLMAGMLSDEESKSILGGKTEEESKIEESKIEELEEENQEFIDMENADDFFKEEIETSKDDSKKQKNKFIENIKAKFKAFKDNADLKSKKANEKVNALLEEPSNSNEVVKKIDQIPINLLIKLLIGLIVLVIIMAVLFINQVYKKNQLANIEKTTVTVPVYKANTANYIFISKEKPFKDSTLKLVKMLIDPVATVFYFDKPIDLMVNEATLKDKNGKSYNMDISFANNTIDNEANYIRFEQLEDDMKEFTLSILDPYTGDHVEYGIELKSYPKVLPAKYLPQQLKAKDSNSSMQLVLENAVFSGVGSFVEYRLNWKDNAETIQLGWKDIPPNGLVNIIEKDVTLSQMKEYPSMYDFANDNTVLGRMDFQSVNNLNSTVEVVFKNLYKQKNITEKIDLASILYSGSQYEDENNYISIDLDNYKLVLERFGDFGERCYLVYHVEDKITGARVETMLASELVISDDSGMEVLFKGECVAKEEGGGIEFNTESSKDILDILNNKKYEINITNVGVKFPDQSFTIDLSQLDDTNIQADKKNVKEFVLESFKKRLSVKSGEIDKKELESHFKDYILKEEAIIRDYLQPIKLVEPADYTSQIITMGKNDADIYYAVVQDYWKGNEDLKEVHFYRTHKIIVQEIAGSFIITEDIIIK